MEKVAPYDHYCNKSVTGVVCRYPLQLVKTQIRPDRMWSCSGSILFDTDGILEGIFSKKLILKTINR